MSQNYTIVNGELYHYGVKGQKWGVRRKRELDEARQRYDQAKRQQLDYENKHMDSSWRKSKDPYSYKDARTEFYYSDKTYRELSDKVSRYHQELSKMERKQVREASNRGKASVGALLAGTVGAIAVAGITKGLMARMR